MHVPATFEELIAESRKSELYKKLIDQLNKDFLLANIELDFHEDVLPSSIKFILQETVYNLIQHKFIDYLNLLYIIDVPEYKVRQLDGEDTLKQSEQVSFLILKRVWQKVWYRHHN